MNYKNFIKEVVENVTKNVDDATVMVKPIRRNNDISSDGLNIVKDDNIFSPTVFLDECYEDYLKGRTIGKIVSDITSFYNSHEESNSLDISYFYDFSEVAEHLAFKIINYERNIDLLREVPHEIFLDFAVVCYCLVVHPVFGTGSILVKNAHLDYWNVSKASLFSVAKENASKIQPYKITSAKDELDRAGMETFEYPVMYMLTNEMNYYGAACLLYEGALDEIADILENDLYILPSSVDEVFIITKNEMYESSELKEMVMDINKHFVSKESFLSNNVYVYDRADKKIKIV